MINWKKFMIRLVILCDELEEVTKIEVKKNKWN